MGMQLLGFADLKAICDRAIVAGLALEHDALFFGISADVVASTTSSTGTPNDDLRIEVNRLNTYVDRTTSDGYFLALWLINAADKIGGTRPADSQFFRDWATTVNNLPPAAPAPGNLAADLPSAARAAEQTNSEVNLAAEILRGSIAATNRRATNLMVSKRLHDALHHIQLYIVPLWSTAVAAMSTAPALARTTVEDRQRDLRGRTQAIATEFSFLPQGEPLRVEAEKTAADLKAAADAATAALAADNVAGIGAAIARVRNVVMEAMPAFANRMAAYQEGLDLTELVTNLNRMAEGAPDTPLAAAASRSASSLAAIIQDLELIGPQHNQWQLLDVRLGNLENLFGFLPMAQGIYSSFDLEWSSANENIDELSVQPPTDRFDRIKALRDQFLAACPVPIQGPPNDQATRLFGDFVIEVRTVFLEVDRRMKEICNQLREITSQLAPL